MKRNRNRVRNQHGVPLLCCWDDCYETGLYEHRAQDGESILVFCTDRHLSYWRHSHVANGRLPAGDRRLWMSSRRSI